MSPPLYCWPVLRSTVTHLEFPTHSPLELQVLACGTTMPVEVASSKLDSAGGEASSSRKPSLLSSVPQPSLIVMVTGAIVLFHLQV